MLNGHDKVEYKLNMGLGTRWASQSNQIHVEADQAGSKWVKVDNHCHASHLL